MKAGMGARVPLPPSALLLPRGFASLPRAARDDLEPADTARTEPAPAGTALDDLPVAFAADPSSLLEFHTASAPAPFPLASINGSGASPFPAAICAMGRPEATERSSSSSAS